MHASYKLLLVSTLLGLFSACNSGEEKKTEENKTTAAVEKKNFPESTDSLANGLHPYFPTEDNIVGKWILPHPMDTSANKHESYMEFLADKSVKVEEYPYLKPVKWQLTHNELILLHESVEKGEAGKMLSDTMIIEAVSDTTLHFYHIHEPNFLMYLVKKK
jgi:Lipocalin-like